jgi:manganese/zinc/iron transport system permease protein
MMEFFTFSDPNVRMVTLGAMLLGASAAIVGCFTFVRKRALVGDAIAHSVLPGVCLAFMISGDKKPLVLLLGAVIAGWISLLVMDAMVNLSKLKTDTAIGAVLSVFFGLGILLLTAIQHSGSANQAGLDKFLFGKAASMTGDDVMIFGSVAVLLLGITGLLFRPFTYVAFDRDFAHTTGLPVRLIEFVLATITVLAVAVGIQAVGVVLMAALLITPAAAARFWTNRLPRMVLLAAIFGIAAGYFGAGVSYLAPSMPTGPWIVMLLSAVALVSVIFAPKQGIGARRRMQRANARKILAENILKAFFKLEAHEDSGQPLAFEQLRAVRGFRRPELRRGLKRLRRAGLVTPIATQQWQLTPAGINQSRRVVRLHRLWELYLNRRLQQAPDHVHNSAEAIEHILTPEVEAALLAELGHPLTDPHESPIPYDPNGNS